LNTAHEHTFFQRMCYTPRVRVRIFYFLLFDGEHSKSNLSVGTKHSVRNLIHDVTRRCA